MEKMFTGLPGSLDTKMMTVKSYILSIKN